MFAATKGAGNPLDPNSAYYVGSAVGTTSVSFSSLSLQENDLVVLYTGWAITPPSTPNPGPTTSGYTQAAAATNTNSRLYVGYKFMGSTPDTSVSVTSHPDYSTGTNTIVQVWRNINTSSPMAASAVTNTGFSTSADPSAISFTGNAIVLAVGIADSGGSIQFTGAPSGMSNYVQQHVTPTGSNSSSLAVASVSALNTYNPAAFSDNFISNYYWVTATLALAI